MGVSPITVNRWESGNVIPSLMAQKEIYEICRKNNLDLSDYIVPRERIQGKQNILYNASRFGISGIIQPISRSKCDFGKDFYMGKDPIQPLTLVCNEKTLFFILWILV